MFYFLKFAAFVYFLSLFAPQECALIPTCAAQVEIARDSKTYLENKIKEDQIYQVTNESDNEEDRKIFSRRKIETHFKYGYGNGVDTSTIHNDDGIIGGGGLAGWHLFLIPIAQRLFLYLCIIDMVWKTIKWVLDGKHFSDLIVTFIIKLINTAVIWYLLGHGAHFFESIFEGLISMSSISAVSDPNSGLLVSNTVDSGMLIREAFRMIGIGFGYAITGDFMALISATIFSGAGIFPLYPYCIAVIYISTALLLGHMSSTLILAYLEIHFVVAVSPLVLAIGGSDFFGNTVKSIILHVIGTGVKLLCLLVIGSIVIEAARDMVTLNPVATVKAFIIMSMCTIVYQSVPDKLASIVKGGTADLSMQSVYQSFISAAKYAVQSRNSTKSRLGAARNRFTNARTLAAQDSKNELKIARLLKDKNFNPKKEDAGGRVSRWKTAKHFASLSAKAPLDNMREDFQNKVHKTGSLHNRFVGGGAQSGEDLDDAQGTPEEKARGRKDNTAVLKVKNFVNTATKNPDKDRPSRDDDQNHTWN